MKNGRRGVYSLLKHNLFKMRIVRYLMVGGCSAAVDFLVFAIAIIQFSIHWFPAGVVSFLLATGVNYLLSITFVFSSGVRFSKRQELIAVLAVSAIGLAMNQTILWILIEGGLVTALEAKLIATASVFLWNYSARRNLVFAPRRGV